MAEIPNVHEFQEESRSSGIRDAVVRTGGDALCRGTAALKLGLPGATWCTTVERACKAKLEEEARNSASNAVPEPCKVTEGLA